MTVQINRGESYTVGIVINTSFTIQNIVVQFAGQQYKISDNTLIKDGEVYLVKIKSYSTKTLLRKYSLVVAVDTLELGVKKTNDDDFCIQVLENSNAFSDDSESQVVNSTFNITIENNELTTDITLANIYRGFSAYEIAVENGFSGTENQWLDSLKLQIQTAATFSAIGNSTEKRFVHVVADETNEGATTLYFHDSIGLNYIPTRKLY